MERYFMNKYAIIFISLSILFFSNLVSCKFSDRHDVTYKALGDASSVTISATGIATISTNLPWENQYTAEATSGDNVSCSLTVKNNTSEDATVIAQIYLDNVLKEQKSLKGPYASVSVSTSISCDGCIEVE
jgi:hypothetical protein